MREKKSNKLKETKEKYNHINARGGFFFFFNSGGFFFFFLVILRGCLVSVFKQQFSVFKQHFTYFHTLFHPYVFLQKFFKQQFSVFKHMYQMDPK